MDPRGPGSGDNVARARETTDAKQRRKDGLIWKENELQSQTDLDPNLAMPFTDFKLGRII